MALELSEAVRKEALELLTRGEVIMCVKLLREATGCGLAEAKAWVDRLAASADPEESALGRQLEAQRAAADAARTKAELEHNAALRAAQAMSLAPQLLELCWQLQRARQARDAVRLAQLDLALLQWPKEQVQAGLLLAGELEHRAGVLCDMARGGWSKEGDVDFNLRQLCPGFSEAAYRETLNQAWQDSR